jgi:hypothetical protein
LQLVAEVFPAQLELLTVWQVLSDGGTQPGIDAQFGEVQLEIGVPAQRGPVLKTFVSPVRRVNADLQQIWFLQSLD